MKRVLVVAPHPDDEVLGVGGTIARLSDEGATVVIVIVTKGRPPLFSEADVAQTRGEAARAHEILGVSETLFLDFPAAGLDGVPHQQLNAALASTLERVAPTSLFLPFYDDLHLDHRLVFRSALVAARPSNAWAPKQILAYETLSETNWNAPYLTAGFQPSVFIDISSTLDRKLAAMRCFASQIKEFPHERSIEIVHTLATIRGSTVSRRAAESFVLVRHVV